MPLPCPPATVFSLFLALDLWYEECATQRGPVSFCHGKDPHQNWPCVLASSGATKFGRRGCSSKAAGAECAHGFPWCHSRTGALDVKWSFLPQHMSSLLAATLHLSSWGQRRKHCTFHRMRIPIYHSSLHSRTSDTDSDSAFPCRTVSVTWAFLPVAFW